MSTPPPGIDADRVRVLNERVAQMAARAREAGQQLEHIAVEATSRDRSVTVTVGSGGILKSVRPGAAASGISPTKLCTSIMEAYGAAARSAAAEASTVMEQITGRDTQVMQRMRAAMPVEEDEQP